MKSKASFICEDCGDSYGRRTEIVEHLKDHLNEAGQTTSICEGQLEDLGIENPYE